MKDVLYVFWMACFGLTLIGTVVAMFWEVGLECDPIVILATLLGGLVWSVVYVTIAYVVDCAGRAAGD